MRRMYLSGANNKKNLCQPKCASNWDFGHDTEASVSKYIKQHEIQWPVALMSEEFKDKFRTSSYPTYFLISATGDIILITNDSESILDYFDQ